MKIDRPNIRARFNGAGRCELCGVWCQQRECLHILSRGAGHVDLPCNLLGVGRTTEFHPCHTTSHTDWKKKEFRTARMLEIAAKREGTDTDSIVQVVSFFRKLDKTDSPERIQTKADLWPLCGGARLLLGKCLKELEADCENP